MESLQLRNCPICGTEPNISSRDMAHKGHGYPGCTMIVIHCSHCGILPEIVENNIDNNEINPKPAAIAAWNKQVDRINDLIDITRNKGA